MACFMYFVPDADVQVSNKQKELEESEDLKQIKIWVKQNLGQVKVWRK